MNNQEIRILIGPCKKKPSTRTLYKQTTMSLRDTLSNKYSSLNHHNMCGLKVERLVRDIPLKMEKFSDSPSPIHLQFSEPPPSYSHFPPLPHIFPSHHHDLIWNSLNRVCKGLANSMFDINAYKLLCRLIGLRSLFFK